MSKIRAVASLLDGFNNTYDTARRVMQNNEIADINNAEVKPVGGTDPNQAEMDKQLADGAGVGEAKTLAGARVPQKFEYLGKTYDATPTDQEKQLAQSLAMAKVVGKYDPAKGLSLANSATQAQRENERFGMEKARFDHEQKKAKKEEEDNKLFTDIEKRTGDWMSARLTNADGTMRPATTDDHLEAANYRVSQLTQAGKVDEAMKRMADVNAASFTKIHLETAQRDRALGESSAALASGDTSKMVDFYNKFVPDGAKVTGIERGPKGEYLINRETTDGEKLPVVSMGDINQFTSTLGMFKDPKSLYEFASKEREYRLKQQHLDIQERQANSTIGLHSAQTDELKSKTSAHKELAAIHSDLNDAIDAGDKKAEDDARKKLSVYMRSGKNSDMPAVEKVANANLASGRAKTMAEALEMAQTKNQTSARDQYMGLAQKGLSQAEIDQSMATAFGPNWISKVQGTDATPTTKLPAGIPAGSRQIGTSGGKPVYQTPGGKKLIVD